MRILPFVVFHPGKRRDGKLLEKYNIRCRENGLSEDDGVKPRRHIIESFYAKIRF